MTIHAYTTKSELDRLTYDIVGAAIHVHKSLGPGLPESIYHNSYQFQLQAPVHRGTKNLR